MIRAARHLFGRFARNRSGAVTVEAGLISGFFVVCIGAAIELGFALWQWNAVQQSARVGVRIAATSDPVARELETMTGLENDTEPGDPMPDYTIYCSGSSGSCSSGNINSAELNRIIYGADNDGVCGQTERERRGVCDLLGRINAQNVEITYRNSGLGTAGNPGNPRPLITLTISDVPLDFAFLDLITNGSLVKIPEVRVSAVAEDLRSGP